MVGYGCTTCIGNSGPLPEVIAQMIDEHSLVTAAVLSGNRNFEARVHPQVRANYLASPMLVVAFALAGRVDIDLTREPIGTGRDGKPVFLQDIWPSAEEIQAAMAASLKPELFERRYASVFEGDEIWKGLKVPDGQPVRVGRRIDLRAGAAVLRGPAARAARRCATSAARGCSRCWATR